MAYTEIVQNLRLNQFENDNDKHKSLNEMIELANNEKGRNLLCESTICDFICDTLHLEKSVEIVTSLCVLIGYLGLSDKYRPILFKNEVANIIVNAFEHVHSFEDKLKIIKASKYLSQTKDDAIKLIEAGLMAHLCDALRTADTDIDKKSVSFYIFWLSYITHNKKTALNYNCVELMYNAVESISNKPIQSHILTDMNYFVSDELPYSKYPIYTLWRTDFQLYLKV